MRFLASDGMKSGTSWSNLSSSVLRNYAYLYLYDNTYDELGRLKTNKKNKQSVLSCSYAYNIRS
ncbi:MAG: hypothetical protein ACK5KV_02175 [Bacteroides graminisolvens]|uniref:hypothetical protein n=1 Tax=Bacteroides graminisolvens TaxID=477666 RepID=UPI003A887FBF